MPSTVKIFRDVLTIQTERISQSFGDAVERNVVVARNDDSRHIRQSIEESPCLGKVAAMKAHAESMLGLPYTLRNYFKPWTKPTKGTWCSPYVARVLNASGRYTLTKTDWWEPQDLFQRLEPDYCHVKLAGDDAPRALSMLKV